jgi:hypothetical protein
MWTVVWVFRSKKSCPPSCGGGFLDLLEGKLWLNQLIEFVFE